MACLQKSWRLVLIYPRLIEHSLENTHMLKCTTTISWFSLVLMGAADPLAAEIKTLVEMNETQAANAEFKFKSVPAPSATDAANKAKFTILDGRRDDNGGEVDTSQRRQAAQ